MNRNLVALSLRSGIPAAYWREHVSDALTALELYRDWDEGEQVGGRPKSARVVMSG